MNAQTRIIGPIYWLLLVGCVFLLLLLVSCRSSHRKVETPDEVLILGTFRLLHAPQKVIQRHHRYVNRSFPMPSYRTPQGKPLPGWRSRVVTTRRFFTDQSARIYYRLDDLFQSRVFSSTSPAATEAMRIWPVGAILVLETFPARESLVPDPTPTAVDCIRKFKPDDFDFPINTLFAGEWSYQRFNVNGKPSPMPAGAGACHQCHRAAFRVTGDLVFTVFLKADDRS